jgi:signal transduction histidine kinase
MTELYLVIILVLLIGFGIAFYFIYRHYEKLMKKEIKRAQKSEQLKSVFIENICHTLHTPLNAILSYSNLILEEKDETMPTAQVKEMATNISKNSEQLIHFVSQLFELSKFEGVTPSFTFIEVNLIELMASYRREALNLTKPDVSVHVRTDLSPHCKATLDTNFMHQIMMHLLANAARHTTQGDIIIKYGNERKGLRVVITYTGIGQAELIGTDIYSFLQKEDALLNSDESSLLGLSICKAIVEILGGEFYMDTEYNKKTVVTFWIPCKMVDKHKEHLPFFNL